MTLALGGAAGLILALGLLLAIRSAPPMRPVRLAERIAPYLGDTPAPSRLLAGSRADVPAFEVVRRVFGPTVGEVTGALDRLVGGTPSVRRRLRGLNLTTTVDDFRLEQVLSGVAGLLVAGGGVALLTALRGTAQPFLAFVAGMLGLVAGVLGRDWLLGRALRSREQQMLDEFPVVADLLALAVVAGEAPADALERVCRIAQGELTRDLGGALARARAGEPLTTCLGDLAETTTLEPFSRFLQGMVVAIERGTAMAEVLRAQAADVREAGKRSLLEAGGRKEISMMLPVVFLILPVTVLFALYPGLLTLVSVTN